MHVFENKIIRPVMTRLAQISIDQISPKMTVFGRFACLGRAILSKSFRESSVRVLNHQKLRIDGLVDILMDQNLILKNNYDKNQVDGFSISKDLKGWIAEVYNQNLLRDLYSADLFFFDSFSDLTDRLFLHNDFAFFAHGIDVRDQENLVDNGYLDTSNMLESFSRFLSFVSSLNSAPIFMIHYSSRHDSRNLFQKKKCRNSCLIQTIRN